MVCFSYHYEIARAISNHAPVRSFCSRNTQFPIFPFNAKRGQYVLLQCAFVTLQYFWTATEIPQTIVAFGPPWNEIKYKVTLEIRALQSLQSRTAISISYFIGQCGSHKCCISMLADYLLTPWCRVLLEKLTCLQVVRKFPGFYGTLRFITALTSVRHLSLIGVSPIQSTFPNLISCRAILILSTHLRLSLPSGLFVSGFTTKTL